LEDWDLWWFSASVGIHFQLGIQEWTTRHVSQGAYLAGA